jgi:hypothetical protein
MVIKWRRIGKAEYVAGMREVRNGYKTVVRKPEEK